MLKRRSHNKSRNGCSSCKRRHVKCDEQGPPCLNCVVRETSSECEYSQATQSVLGPIPPSPHPYVLGHHSHHDGGRAGSVPVSVSTPLPQQFLHYDGSSSSTVSISLSAAPTTDSGFGLGLGGSSAPPSSRGSTPPMLPPPPPPPQQQQRSEARRLMDIELMHRWSTHTYKTFCSVAEDDKYLQIELPREAMRSEHLLNSLLAITALEKAMIESPAAAGAESHQPGSRYNQHYQPLPQQLDHSSAGRDGLGSAGPSSGVDMLMSTNSSSNNSRSSSSGGGGGGGGPMSEAGHDHLLPTSNVARVYVHAAMEYYDRAIVGLRAALANMVPSQQHNLFFSSVLAALFHVLMPQCIALRDREAQLAGEPVEHSSSSSFSVGGMGGDDHSAIAHVVSLFDLLNGSSSIVATSWSGMMDSPAGASIASALSHGLPDMYALEPDLDAALHRLAVLAAATGPRGPDGSCSSSGLDAVDDGDDGVTAPAEALLTNEAMAVLLNGTLTGPLREAVPSAVVARGTAPRSEAARRRDMYRNVVFFLRYGFAEGSRAAYKFSGVGFPMMGGREFAGAVARHEPLALLIVAFWGIMLGQPSNVAWWTSSIGRDLVAEVSEALVLLEMRGRLTDGFGRMPEWRESISWARTRVGLPSVF